MAALIVPAGPAGNTSPPSVQWRRIAWVTWRQHRFALMGVAVFLGAVAACLWLVGRHVHDAYAAAAACHPVSSPACAPLLGVFNGMDDFLANGGILQAVPALIGAFAGAPVLARELETGTFRYAWTQGFGRDRWTLGKLVALAVAVTAMSGAVSVLVSWYYQPYLAARNVALSLPEASPFEPTLFDLRGVAFAAWTLAAFAIGALAGMLIRRVVPAIVATLIVYAALAFATGAYLRLHYLRPFVTRTQNLATSAYVTGQWGTKGGKLAFAGQPPARLLQELCTAPARGVHIENKSLFVAQCLSQHGYTWWTSYQPASRFWPFQLIEGGWLVASSMLLIGVTVWLVRRRAA